MRKFLSFGLVLAFSFVSAVVPANSAVKLGDACKSLGKTTSVNGSTLICTKSGSKLVWIKRSKADSYDAAFANAFLAEAKRTAAKIIEDAKSTANQISSPPYCSTGNSSARASIGSDGNLRALVFENPGICDITVRASASFRCDSPLPPSKNTVRSTGVFPLRAKEKLIFSNWSYYFPQVNLECRLLTGSSGLAINLSRDGQEPSVMTLTSSYSGNFNQVEASKRADQHLKTEKARADKVIADAKNPDLITKAWKIFISEKAATEKAAIEKAAIEKAAIEKAAIEKAAAAGAIGKICVILTECRFGNIGPGGGIVFYDAGSQQSWGRFLELAPEGWSGSSSDPATAWCDVTNQLLASVKGAIPMAFTSGRIGTGKANTDFMLSVCISGAAEIARAYRGGGKSDWYLPSAEELNEMCKYARNQITGDPFYYCQSKNTLREGFLDDAYWSSTEAPSSGSNYLYFPSNAQFGFGSKASLFRVRPIRAF